jgi:hypothetical protein
MFGVAAFDPGEDVPILAPLGFIEIDAAKECQGRGIGIRQRPPHARGIIIQEVHLAGVVAKCDARGVVKKGTIRYSLHCLNLSVVG